MKKGHRETSFWDAWRKYPPAYIRLLAKQSHSIGMSDAEIAIASGIDLNRVREIKMIADPFAADARLTFGEALRYSLACNFDPTNPRHRVRAVKYERTCQQRNVIPFLYLRRHPRFESEILPVLMLYRRLMTQQSSAA